MPVRDDVGGLRRCLDGLRRQTLAPDRFEVIVVDNGSEDDPGGVVADFGFAKLIHESRPGSYAARNAGVAVSGGEVVAFIDADCVPEPGWLEEGVAALRADAQVGLVAGRVRVHARDRSRPTMVELYELRHAFPQERYASQVGFAATANAFTTRAVLEATGGFLSDIASGGDREWGARVRAAGYGVAYCPDAVVSHPARRTWGEYLRKAERVHEGVLALRERGLISDAPASGPAWARHLPPVRTCVRALADPDLTPPQWARYCLAITLVRYTRLMLRLRRAWARGGGERRSRAPAGQRRGSLRRSRRAPARASRRQPR